MNRKQFLQQSLKLGVCSSACYVLNAGDLPAASPSEQNTEAPKDFEKEFVQNFLNDLMDTIDSELDEKTKVRLMAGCGRGCFRRFSFKQDLAKNGEGSLEKLIQAYKKNFEIWQDGNLVHIRYGEVSNGCYCPAARYRPPKPNDIHCNCTRATHQTIFETALGRPFQVDIVETLRRGGKTCHFVVHLT
jgi:hypothetical protein